MENAMPKQEKRTTVTNARYWRAELTLPWELDTYLSEFGKKCKRMGGAKIAKTEIIRALIRVLTRLDVDTTEVMDETMLETRIMQAIEDRRKVKKRKVG